MKKNHISRSSRNLQPFFKYHLENKSSKICHTTFIANTPFSPLSRVTQAVTNDSLGLARKLLIYQSLHRKYAQEKNSILPTILETSKSKKASGFSDVEASC